jgi:tetratricopeptide (TPR) repeat protein
VSPGGRLTRIPKRRLAIAYYNRAILYNAQGNQAAALQDYSDALAADSEMHIVYLARGTAFREQGDLQAAGQDFYNRIITLGNEYIDHSGAIGDSFAVEMDYQRIIRITFEGSAGQVVTIAAREAQANQTDPLIALLDPSGTPIAGDDDSGGNFDSQLDNFTLPATGNYTLLVSHAEGAYDFGYEGTVQITING